MAQAHHDPEEHLEMPPSGNLDASLRPCSDERDAEQAVAPQTRGSRPQQQVVTPEHPSELVRRSHPAQFPGEAANRPIMVPTGNLRPHPLSLAIYDDEQVDPDLAQSIRERGILEPLVILSDGTIVSGHRRWRAALANGLEDVPARLCEFESELDEQAAVIEHNRQRVKSLTQRMREADELEAIERLRPSSASAFMAARRRAGRLTVAATLPAVSQERPARGLPPPWV